MKVLILSLLAFALFCSKSFSKNETFDREEYKIRVIEKSGADFLPLADTLYKDEDFTIRYGSRIMPPPLNFNQDISKIPFDSLRFLKFELYARRGYLFMDVVLRNHFNQFNWYQPVYWLKGFNMKLSEQEEAFYQRIKKREAELIDANYIKQNSQETANIDNIVNKNQFSLLAPPILKKLKENGFAICNSDHNEIFYSYESNDYKKIPSFITTDAYLQVFHEYFVYALRSIEESQFVPLIKDLSKRMQIASNKLANSPTKNLEMKSAAEFNSFYYAVATYLISGEKLDFPKKYTKNFEEQIRRINSAEGIDTPDLFDNARIDYSLFKPRGIYTRTKRLQAYFKTMMWLGTAPYKLNKESHIARLALSASILNSESDSSGKKLLNKYLALYDVIGLFIGEADNPSCYNVLEILKDNKINLNPEELINTKNIKIIVKNLLVSNNRKIIPAGPDEFNDKSIYLNFLPQRYTPDAEMMSRLVNLVEGFDRREFPKGLDVFAAFGNKSAEDILLNVYYEAKLWKGYKDSLNKLKREFKSYDYSKNIYSSWIGSLNSLFEPNDTYPYFMKLDAWKKKNLNTSLASWAEIKHDAILYAKEPFGAEGGGDDYGGFELPPDPDCVGYVEPNIIFWGNSIALLNKIQNILNKYSLNAPNINKKTSNLLLKANFLKRISEKELKHINLSDSEYVDIRKFGDEIANLTYDLRCFVPFKEKEELGEDEYNSDSEGGCNANEESMPVIADVFTTTSSFSSRCLEVATGNAHDIYVVVDIGGYFYLTKGSVFSYYEFTQPISSRLTDEEWREALKNKKLSDLQSWWLNYYSPSNAIGESVLNVYPFGLYDRYLKSGEEEFKKSQKQDESK